MRRQKNTSDFAKDQDCLLSDWEEWGILTENFGAKMRGTKTVPFQFIPIGSMGLVYLPTDLA